jgi:hypothetical protein
MVRYSVVGLACCKALERVLSSHFVRDTYRLCIIKLPRYGRHRHDYRHGLNPLCFVMEEEAGWSQVGLKP